VSRSGHAPHATRVQGQLPPDPGGPGPPMSRPDAHRSFVKARAALAAVAAVAVLAGLAQGISQVRIETGVAEFVPRDDPAMRVTEEVAGSFGGDPVVVLLEGDRPGALLDKARLPELLRLEGELAGLPDVHAVYGPATVLNQIAG